MTTTEKDAQVPWNIADQIIFYITKFQTSLVDRQCSFDKYAKL